MDTCVISAIFLLFLSVRQPLTTCSLDYFKAHTETLFFLFTAQVYFLDLASNLNNPNISLGSKPSDKMGIAND
jgi:hypothetical protein